MGGYAGGLKMRELTREEREEIKSQSKLIKHYRTGILLARLKIKMIKDKPQVEEWTERVLGAVLEF
jgi:hypothetical protein